MLLSFLHVFARSRLADSAEGPHLDLHGIRVGTVQNEGLSGSVGSEIARRVALAVFADFGCFASIAVAQPLNAQGQQSRAFRT